MKDLLLCVHVVATTLNLKISRCYLTDYVKELYLSACRTCGTIFVPHSTNQIIVFWPCRCRYRSPCLSSLLKEFQYSAKKNILKYSKTLGRRKKLGKIYSLRMPFIIFFPSFSKMVLCWNERHLYHLRIDLFLVNV